MTLDVRRYRKKPRFGSDFADVVELAGADPDEVEALTGIKADRVRSWGTWFTHLVRADGLRGWTEYDQEDLESEWQLEWQPDDDPCVVPVATTWTQALVEEVTTILDKAWVQKWTHQDAAGAVLSKLAQRWAVPAVVHLDDASLDEVERIAAAFTRHGGPRPLIVAGDIELLDEDQMRELGWIRAVSGE